MTERLDAAATRARLDYPALLDALERALVEVAERRIACPPRLVVPMADGAMLLSMPAVADDLAIHKLITVAPGNRARGLPAILGTVTAIDPASGEPLLVLDGPTVTGRRTAAMSMLATALLQPGPVDHALLIGTGVQAGHHVEALAALHPAAVIHVRGSSDRATHVFCERHAAVGPSLRPDDGTSVPDVVFTCTTSRVPVYRAPADPRRLVVATGAFEPDAAEIDPAVVRASIVYVDDLDGARHEAGDLVRAGVDWSAVRPLVAALTGARRLVRQPTLVKTVGCAAWDLAAARVALASGARESSSDPSRTPVAYARRSREENPMRVKMSDTTAEATRIARLEHERFVKACEEVLNGNPYDADWLEQLRAGVRKADDAMKASWAPVDD